MNLERQNWNTVSLPVPPGFDDLTGLANRALFLSRVNEALDARKKDEVFAVLFLSLDHFPEVRSNCDGLINRLIGAIGGRIRRSLPPENFLARVQHHGFAVLLNRINHLAEIDSTCQEIQKAFQTSFRVDENTLKISMSMGIAIASSKCDTAEGLLQEASTVASDLQKRGRGLYTCARLSPGTRLDRFEITSFLARGGMGEVYCAQDTMMKREVAIKILNGDINHDPYSLDRFHQESHAAATISHPNVMDLIDTGTFHGRCFIVMERFKGETLRAKLQNRRLRADQVMNYAIQIAEGVAALHEKGIVHGDLKPENIFITEDDQIKILDFGLAKFLSFQDSEYRESGYDAKTEITFGTLCYMSPEQVQGTSTNERSDIFSFGAVLYEMLCGKQAFDGLEIVNILRAILKKEPSLMNSAQIPETLRPVLTKCLNKMPGERFATASELATALKNNNAGAINDAPTMFTR